MLPNLEPIELAKDPFPAKVSIYAMNYPPA